MKKIILTLLVFCTITTIAMDKEGILYFCVWANESISYSTKVDPIPGDTAAYDSLMKLQENVNNNPDDPNLRYELTTAARDYKRTAEWIIDRSFREICDLYAKLEKKRPLAGKEIQQWAESISQTESEDKAIEFAEKHIDVKLTDIHIVYQFLADSYANRAIGYIFDDISSKSKSHNINISIEEIRKKAMKFDAKGSDRAMFLAKSYFKKAEQSTNFSKADHDYQASAEGSIRMGESFLKALKSTLKKKRFSDKDFESILTTFLKEFVGHLSGPGYIRNLVSLDAEDSPEIKAALIWFEVLKIASMKDFEPKIAFQSTQTKAAIKIAKDKFIAMTKEKRSEAYGYDGLVALDIITENENAETYVLATKALALCPTIDRSFNYCSMVDFEEVEVDYDKIIQRAKKKTNIDHSAYGYFVFLRALAESGRANDARSLLVETLKYAPDYDNAMREQFFLIEGNINLYARKNAQAISIYLDIEKGNYSRNTKARALVNMAIAYYILDNAPIAISTLDKLAMYSDQKDIADYGKGLRKSIAEEQEK